MKPDIPAELALALPQHNFTVSYDALKDSRLDGMQLFDDALAQLYAEGKIDFTTGLHAATSSQGFKMAATQIDLQAGVRTGQADRRG
jgi:Tfp pilus assembly ATPase PilU